MDQPNKSTNPVESENLLVDLGRHLAYSAIQKPVTAVAQICGGKALIEATQLIDRPVDAAFGSGRWHAEQIASNTGAIVPFVASLALVRGGAKLGVEEKFFQTLKGPASSTARAFRTAEMTGAGAINGALFEPSESDHLLSSRLTQATVGGVTMGVMHRLSNSLSALTGASNLSAGVFNKSLTAGLAGAGGGIAGIKAESTISGGKMPDSESAFKSIYAAAWAGAGLSILGGSSSKLHQPKSSMPELEAHVATNSVKDSAPSLNTATQLILSDNVLGRTQLASAKVGHKVSQFFGAEDSSSAAARFEADISSFRFSNLGPADRVEMIALLEQRASSRLVNGPTIEKFYDVLVKDTESWNADKLTQVKLDLLNARKKLDDAIAEDDRVRMEHSDQFESQFGHLRLMEQMSASNEFWRVREPLLKQLESQKKTAQVELDEAFVNQDQLLNERAETLNQSINKFLEQHNLPPVKVEATLLFGPNGSYSRGTLQVNQELLAQSRLTNRQVELLMHELVHHEQDVKSTNLIADRLAIKDSSDESFGKMFNALDKLDQKGFKTDADRSATAENHVWTILTLRGDRSMSRAEAVEAKSYLKAYENYVLPNTRMQTDLQNILSSIDNVRNRNPYDLLKQVRENPNEFKGQFGMLSIPKAIRKLSEQASEPMYTAHTARSVESIQEQRNRQSQLAEEIASALEPRKQKISGALEFYRKRQQMHYLTNELERPAWAAGALTRTIADMRSSATTN